MILPLCWVILAVVKRLVVWFILMCCLRSFWRINSSPHFLDVDWEGCCLVNLSLLLLWIEKLSSMVWTFFRWFIWSWLFPQPFSNLTLVLYIFLAYLLYGKAAFLSLPLGYHRGDLFQINVPFFFLDFVFKWAFHNRSVLYSC